MMTSPHSTRPRPVAALALALGALLALTGLIARPATASAGGARWTLAPAANAFGAGRHDFGFTLGPGGTLRDGVAIHNPGDVPLRLTLRPADAVTTATGALRPVGTGAGARDVGSWVRLERDAVTVAPGASVTVAFTLAPPKGAAAGDHVGGIVAVPAGAGPDAGGRRELRMRLRVSGPLKPGLAVRDIHMDYSGTANPLGAGEATVSYTIHNTGNAILTARPAVSASGPFGIGARHAARLPDSPPLLPGATWTATAPLRDVAPALRLSAKVAVTPLLADAAGSVAPLAATRGTGHAVAVPWSLVVVVVVVLAGGAAGVAARRRRLGAPRRRVKGAVA